ncbi:zinc metallochaperone AztD [Nocardia shimofusensis]|uniref:zinc metallochaperone AztD n=1 Tax=Nocardia shimofusensis TaxID=228596 RepID=UPI0008299026|nr:zinc metallochaperone AztD [Nocardia shimofusensis]
MRIRSTATVLAGLLTATVALSACGSGDEDEATASGHATVEPIAVTFDGGIHVLDGRTLELAATTPLAGFNRLNPAGDERHLMVSTDEGFRVYDALTAEFTDIAFPGPKPGHVVRHAGRTVLFTDGTGEIVSFDPADLSDPSGDAPPTRVHRTAAPHHGVAVEMADGSLVLTVGTEQRRSGLMVLDAQGEEIARNEDCPGVHGEATAKDETVVVGCENGVLVYRDGVITKIDGPTPYSRIGNQAGSPESAVVLGDYKQDEDAELERPQQVSLIDTATGQLRLVDLGASYTFRSLGRGPRGEALVLATDGRLHVIDPVAGTVVRSIAVLEPWQEPLKWQQARPALFVRGGDAYVSDPATSSVHRIDLAAGEVRASVTLPDRPNELSGVGAH